MTGQIVAALFFLAVVVGVPLLLLLWARHARMYSGRALPYDGPLAHQGLPFRGQPEDVGAPEECVPPNPRSGVEAGEGSALSDAEREQWEQLVHVSWELPPRRDGRV